MNWLAANWQGMLFSALGSAVLTAWAFAAVARWANKDEPSDPHQDHDNLGR